MKNKPKELAKELLSFLDDNLKELSEEDSVSPIGPAPPSHPTHITPVHTSDA